MSRMYMLSIFSWKSELLHREHSLAKAFSNNGEKVTYIERKFSFNLSKYQDGNIEVVPVFALPYLRGRFQLVFTINDFILSLQLKRIVERNASLWCSGPLWSGAAANLKRDCGAQVIYDISDDDVAFATNKKWKSNLSRYRDQLIRLSDKVVVTSQSLQELLPSGKEVLLAANGVDVEEFSKAKDLLHKRYSAPIVGFIGGIYKRVDFSLVENAVKLIPEATFVLVGPTDRQAEIKALSSRYHNFHYLGLVNKNAISNYFASLDAAIIPYVGEDKFEWLKTVDNLKIYQHLYFGTPVVVTEYGNVKDLEPDIYVSTNPEDFLHNLGLAISGKETGDQFESRKKVAIQHDWATISKDILKFIRT